MCGPGNCLSFFPRGRLAWSRLGCCATKLRCQYLAHFRSKHTAILESSFEDVEYLDLKFRTHILSTESTYVPTATLYRRSERSTSTVSSSWTATSAAVIAALSPSSHGAVWARTPGPSRRSARRRGQSKSPWQSTTVRASRVMPTAAGLPDMQATGCSMPPPVAAEPGGFSSVDDLY